jgi:hypothetical protein
MKVKFYLFFSTILLICFSSNAQQKEKSKNKIQNRGSQFQKSGIGKSLVHVSIPNANLVMGAPTDTSILASVILESGSQAYLEYSKTQGVFSNKTATVISNGHEPLEIQINNLEPNTNYRYRLSYRLPDSKKFIHSAESWFSTQKKPEYEFSFGIQGDSHPERLGKMFNPTLYKQTLENVSIRKLDFYFMMGDDFNIDRFIGNPEANRASIEDTYKIQRSFLGNMGSNPPLFLVNGNHEQTAKYLLNGTPNSAPVIAANARKKFFPLPEPQGFYSGDKDTVGYVGLLKDYYAFEWGNALFVVIDPYWHSDVAVDNQPLAQEKKVKKDQWEITIGDTQYQWLKKTLENSKAKFKFVFAHHVLGTGRGGIERAPFFEWGGKSPNGADMFKQNRPNWEMPIHQLMAKNKVSIFFQGHDHIYAKQELDGVIYQSVPNPADDTHTAFNREAYLSGKILPNSGFLNVTVGPKEVKVEYVRSFLSSSLGKDVTENHTYVIK